MKFQNAFGALVIWVLMIACTASSSEAQTVYITRTGAKYHKGSCQYLRKSKYEITMKEAVDRGYEPCSVCDPGTLSKEKKNASIPERSENKGSGPDTAKTLPAPKPLPQSPTPKQTVSRQCTGTTKAGARCKRMTTSASGRCYQHE